jgi:hypothetical protein
MKDMRTKADHSARPWLVVVGALIIGLVCAREAARIARVKVDPITDSRPGAAPVSPLADRVALSPTKLAAIAPAPQPVATAPSASAARDSDGNKAPHPLDAPTMRQHLEDAWNVQAGQSAWTHGARQIAESKLSALLPAGSAARAVECRASMCRIETEHADVAHYAQFARSAFLEARTQLWNGGVFSAIVEDSSASGGKVISVAYLAGEGQTLPIGDGS